MKSTVFLFPADQFPARHDGQAGVISAIEEPLRLRGQASRTLDSKGIEGAPLKIVNEGVPNHWFLSMSVARELGPFTNGRGARGGFSVPPSSANFVIELRDRSHEDIIRLLKRGFYVTEVFGQGVDMVTRGYSRGASVFWIENGEIVWKMSEVTIASNIKDMFLRMVTASDLDRNSDIGAPPLLIEGMNLARD